jgi:hypothetical protein
MRKRSGLRQLGMITRLKKSLKRKMRRKKVKKMSEWMIE